MASAKRIEKVFNEFMENDFWKEYYDGAKSDKQKEKIKLDFYYSDTDDESVMPEILKLEGEFTVEEWKYELANTIPSPRVGYIKRKMKEAQERENK